MQLANRNPSYPKELNGFTLTELMIVVAVIAIITTIAVPNLLSSRLTANESAVVATLRNIMSAQAQFHAATLIDTDEDGMGEYGYFGELSGATNLRDIDGGLTAPNMTLPVLSGVFRSVRSGLVESSGYFFLVYLPDAAGVGMAEATSGGADAGNLPGADNCEITWCCYAWPANIHHSGVRAFFVNQHGIITQTKNMNAGQNYSGSGTRPAADAAFVDPYVAGSIVDVVAVGTVGSDGGRWTTVE